MKALAIVLALSSVGLYGAANLPKKPLPPRPPVLVSTPAKAEPVKAAQVEAESLPMPKQVKAQQAGTYWLLYFSASKIPLNFNVNNNNYFLAVYQSGTLPPSGSILQGWYVTNAKMDKFGNPISYPTPQAAGVGSFGVFGGLIGNVAWNGPPLLDPSKIGPN
jgi:hypothetical protein